MDDLSNLALKALDSSNLSDEQSLMVAAKLLGYKRMPVDIETFIEDPFYLGNIFGNGRLFPYWKEKLKKLFPTPIHISKMIVVLTGAIGTGKSTFSRICSLYLQHRLDCLEDPYKTLGIAPGKFLNFVFFHTTGAKADSDFVTPNNNNKKMSPYFSTSMLHPELPMADVVDGARSNNSIGGDTVYQVLSELNFVNKEVAKYKLDQAIKRIQSRFLKVVGYFILIIIDTSSRGDDTITDEFIKSNPFVDEVMTIRASIWEAKAHLNLYGRKGWFYVYAGDSTHSPFIVKNIETDITDEMDRDRLIKAPMELYSSFCFDLTSALQDQAGMSTKSSGKLFTDPNKVKPKFCLPKYSDEILTFDFFNKQDKLIYQLDRYLKDIPNDKVIFPRYDIGVTGDKCGLAITYFDYFKFFDDSNRVKMPVYKTPLMVAISRNEGQETSIYHLFEFIMDLNDRFEIGEFTADQFASRQLMQDLTREGIKTRLLSVDRTETPYIYFKNMLLNGLWTGVYSELAIREACELTYVDNKIDHPSTGCFIGSTKVIVRDKYDNIDPYEIKDLIDYYDEFSILSYNIYLNQFEFKQITKVWKTKTVNNLLGIIVNDHVYYCTEDHLWLTEDNEWIKAKDLKYHKVVTTSGLATVQDVIEIVMYNEPVYDIEVEDNHNFCLFNGEVVHNSKDVMDAVCGSVYSCYENLDLAIQLSTKYKYETHNKNLQSRIKGSNGIFEDMLKSMGV